MEDPVASIEFNFMKQLHSLKHEKISSCTWPIGHFQFHKAKLYVGTERVYQLISNFFQKRDILNLRQFVLNKLALDDSAGSQGKK